MAGISQALAALTDWTSTLREIYSADPASIPYRGDQVCQELIPYIACWKDDHSDSNIDIHGVLNSLTNLSTKLMLVAKSRERHDLDRRSAIIVDLCLSSCAFSISKLSK